MCNDHEVQVVHVYVKLPESRFSDKMCLPSTTLAIPFVSQMPVVIVVFKPALIHQMPSSSAAVNISVYKV